VLTATLRETATDGLPAARRRVDLLHVHAPDLLDGPPDLRFRCRVHDDERVLAVLGVGIGLLRDDRLHDDVARITHRTWPPPPSLRCGVARVVLAVRPERRGKARACRRS